MISRTSNQPNFKGSIQYILKSSGASHKISMETTPKEDLSMFLRLAGYTYEPHQTNVTTSISKDGQTLSFTTVPKFMQTRRIRNPIELIYESSKRLPELKPQDEYTARLLHHNKIHSIVFSISKNDFKEAKKVIPNIIKEMNSKEKSLKKIIRNKVWNTICNIIMQFGHKKIVIESLPKADHTKVKAFFKG